MGLPGAKRLMDEMDLQDCARGEGTSCGRKKMATRAEPFDAGRNQQRKFRSTSFFDGAMAQQTARQIALKLGFAAQPSEEIVLVVSESASHMARRSAFWRP